MYHSQVIAAKQRALESKLSRTLTRYSVEQTRFYCDHLDSITIRTPKGKATGFSRTLTPDEIQFIENERALCSIDFLYWAERYLWIAHVISKKLILFSINAAQKIMLSILGGLEKRRLPLVIQSLKARQLGVSTLYEALHLHRFLFVQNYACIIASSDEDKSWKLIDTMMRPSLERQPFWLISTDIQTWETGEQFAVSDKMNSTIYVQHGRQKIGIGRGATPVAWHFSELAEWNNAEQQLKDAFEHGIHYSAITFGVKEGTASGRNNFWHELWKFNEVNYPLKLSLEYPAFLPYFVGSDIYPPPGFLRAIPIPEKWSPPEYAVEHRRSCENYAHSSELLRDALGGDWRMEDSQLWWYVYNYERARTSKEGLGPFLSEVPANPDEAFQSRTGSVFGIDLLQEIRSKCARPAVPPLGIIGSQIPSLVEPSRDEIDTATKLPAILSTLSYKHRQLDFKWRLIPTKFTSYEEVLSPLDRLWIWELPSPNERYVVTMDDADGVEKDSTILEVIKLGSPKKPAVQVAEFASNRLSALDIWPIYLLLLKLYSTVSITGANNLALAAPEINRAGKSVVLELLKAGWGNIYLQRDFSKVSTTNPIQGMGWNTNTSTRYMLTNWFMKFIKNGYYKVNSPWLVDEMRDFTINEKVRTSRLEHGKGAHDDRIFASGIGLVAGHELETWDSDTPYWISIAEKQKSELEIPTGEEFTRALYSTAGDAEIEKQKLLEEVSQEGYSLDLLY